MALFHLWQIPCGGVSGVFLNFTEGEGDKLQRGWVFFFKEEIKIQEYKERRVEAVF